MYNNNNNNNNNIGCLGNGVFTVNDPGFSYTQYSMSDIVREAVYH